MSTVVDILGVISTARKLSRRERWTASQVREWQHHELLELVRFVKENSPFYRKLYAEVEVSDSLRLADLPPVTKAMMMDHFDDFVTDSRLRLNAIQNHLGQVDGPGMFENEFRLLCTAGTTGRRGIFALNRREWASVLASMHRWQRFTGLHPGITKRPKIAVIGSGSHLHASHLLPLGSDVGLYEFIHLAATDPLDHLVRALNEFQPDLLSPYATIAGLLAFEQISGRLSIRPAIVVTHSELLTDEIAARVERAWGAWPFNHYGLSEMPCLGIDCAHHRGIHVFEDLCMIEPVTSAGRPVPGGEIGDKYYLTNLIYRSQPLIRYEVTDRLALFPPDCPCGSPFSLIREMQGRDEETITLEGENGVPVRIPPLALTLNVEDIPGIVEHEICFDEERASIEVQILPEAGGSREMIEAEVLEGMKNLVSRFHAKRPELTVSFVDSFPRNHRVMGKKKRVRKTEGAGRRDAVSPVETGDHS